VRKEGGIQKPGVRIRILKYRLKVFFIHFRFNTPRLAAQPFISQAGIQKKKDWMPDQARHDETTSIPRCLRRGSLFLRVG